MKDDGDENSESGENRIFFCFNTQKRENPKRKTTKTISQHLIRERYSNELEIYIFSFAASWW